MEIYLDTAQREEIELGFALGCVAGVTTNPTILARAGTSLERFIAEVAAPSRNRTFLVQVAMGSKDDMVREAKDLAARAANLVIKIPVTEPGIAAVRTLTDLGIRTALTLVFSRTQAIAAACAGASFVAPFVGRLDDIDSDGVGLVRSIHETFSLQRAGTRIIAASVRGSRSVSELFAAGADVVTMPLAVLRLMLVHPLSDRGLEMFARDGAGLQKHEAARSL